MSTCTPAYSPRTNPYSSLGSFLSPIRDAYSALCLATNRKLFQSGDTALMQSGDNYILNGE